MDNVILAIVAVLGMVALTIPIIIWFAMVDRRQFQRHLQQKKIDFDTAKKAIEDKNYELALEIIKKYSNSSHFLYNTLLKLIAEQKRVNHETPTTDGN